MVQHLAEVDGAIGRPPQMHPSTAMPCPVLPILHTRCDTNHRRRDLRRLRQKTKTVQKKKTIQKSFPAHKTRAANVRHQLQPLAEGE